MKNFEKFKTADEREIAFNEYCNKNSCQACFNDSLIHTVPCLLRWLDLEYKEDKPLPCPFCGENEIVIQDVGGCQLMCDRCGYRTKISYNKSEAIAAHNRVAKAVMDAKKGE